jgi:TPR repeat protein
MPIIQEQTMLKKSLYISLCLSSYACVFGASSDADIPLSTAVLVDSPVQGDGRTLALDESLRPSAPRGGSGASSVIVDDRSDIKPMDRFGSSDEEKKHCEEVYKLALLSKSDKSAWSKLLDLAIRQDVVASAHVGYVHVYGGDFAPKSLALAYKFNLQSIRWMVESSLYDSPTAQFFLAHLYQSGILLEQSPTAAEKLYQKAANNGYGPAQATLGELYESSFFGKPNPKEAEHWFTIAATTGVGIGCGKAQLRMALKELNVKRDIRMAVHWLKLAHKNSNVNATYLLSALHLKHGNILHNASEALEYALHAANSGWVDAMYLIGTIYAHGLIRGVPADEKEGYKWLKAANDVGHPEAMKLIAKYNKHKKF